MGCQWARIESHKLLKLTGRQRALDPVREGLHKAVQHFFDTPSRIWFGVTQYQSAFTHNTQRDATPSGNYTRFDIWAVNIADPNAFIHQEACLLLLLLLIGTENLSHMSD
jgi:hypothetical protein